MRFFFLKESLDNLFYHGSSYNLEVGDVILPPSKTDNISEKGRKKNLDKVFFTKNYKSAKIYAGRSKNSYGGKKYIYIVKPFGDVSVISDKKGSTVYMADFAKIIDKIEIQ
jgi:hypothetical protein